MNNVISELKIYSLANAKIHKTSKSLNKCKFFHVLINIKELSGYRHNMGNVTLLSAI